MSASRTSRVIPLATRLARLVVQALVAAALIASPARAANQLVDVIPQARSAETNQDSQPTLVLNPNDYAQMALATLGWDGASRPVYVSNDGGTTWTPAPDSGDWPSSVALAALLSDQGGAPQPSFPTRGLHKPSGSLGQNVLGALDVSGAVDPNDPQRLYVAFGDGGPGAETVHVRSSFDGGHTWSPDMFNVTSAIDPQIAVNVFGTLGLLYQRYVNKRWETHFVRTLGRDASAFDLPGVLLANTDAITPASAHDPYLGNHAALVAAGRNFFGAFSASNEPVPANFAKYVAYQRYADWTEHKLFAEAAKKTAVAPSIDPFFFEADALAPVESYYVRDWTVDAKHADTGAEPSHNPAFYVSSDVWNRHAPDQIRLSDAPPPSEEARNGAGPAGDNWFFVRVHRNSAGSGSGIGAHYLVARYGTGSNFVDYTSVDPDVSFPESDVVVRPDDGNGPWVSDAYRWHLAPRASHHVSFVVELGSGESPFIPPSLTGRTSGQPTSDRRIVNDNHKAERNEQFVTVVTGYETPETGYAIVHNADLQTRDISLRIGVPAPFKAYIQALRVADTSRPGQAATNAGDVLVVRGVEPGENRWISIALTLTRLPPDAAPYVTVDQLAGDVPIDGFAFGARASTPAAALSEALALRHDLAVRLAAGFDAKADAADDALTPPANLEQFADFLHKTALPHLASDLAHTDADKFGLRTQIAHLRTEATGLQLVADYVSLLNGADAHLTQQQLANGDVADIEQMIRWQRSLFSTRPNLMKLPCAQAVVTASDNFLAGRAAGTLTNSTYPRHLGDVIACLRQGLGSSASPPALAASALAALEKGHRDLLLALSHPLSR